MRQLKVAGAFAAEVKINFKLCVVPSPKTYSGNSAAIPTRVA